MNRYTNINNDSNDINDNGDSYYIPMVDIINNNENKNNLQNTKLPRNSKELLRQSYNDLKRLEEIKNNILKNIEILKEHIKCES
jgi:hypothetical protein